MTKYPRKILCRGLCTLHACGLPSWCSLLHSKSLPFFFLFWVHPRRAIDLDVVNGHICSKSLPPTSSMVSLLYIWLVASLVCMHAGLYWIAMHVTLIRLLQTSQSLLLLQAFKSILLAASGGCLRAMQLDVFRNLLAFIVPYR